MHPRKLESRILQAMHRANREFGLIRGGDRILVAMSGGKDSYGLLWGLSQMNAALPDKFTLVPYHLDQGQPGHDVSPLKTYLEALGLPFDTLEASGGFAVARRPVEIAAGTIEAGTVAAQRTSVSGLRDGRPVMRFTATWYCSTDVEPAWDVRETGWRVVVEGDAPLDVEIRFPVPPERWAATSPGLTAHRAVNAISVVCEAPPGIRTTVDLPQVVARLGPADA